MLTSTVGYRPVGCSKSSRTEVAVAGVTCRRWLIASTDPSFATSSLARPASPLSGRSGSRPCRTTRSSTRVPLPSLPNVAASSLSRLTLGHGLDTIPDPRATETSSAARRRRSWRCAPAWARVWSTPLPLSLGASRGDSCLLNTTDACARGGLAPEASERTRKAVIGISPICRENARQRLET